MKATDINIHGAADIVTEIQSREGHWWVSLDIGHGTWRITLHAKDEADANDIARRLARAYLKGQP